MQKAPEPHRRNRGGPCPAFPTFGKARGVSVLELLVVVAVIAALASLAMPALLWSVKKSRETRSIANLRSIGQAIHLYISDHNGYFPLMCQSDGTTWQGPIWSSEALEPYFSNRSQSPSGVNGVMLDPFIPADKHGGLGDYACNSDVLRVNFPGYSETPGPLALANVDGAASRVIMVTPGEDGGKALPNSAWYFNAYAIAFNPSGAWTRPSDRNTGRILSLFIDGHTEAIGKDRFIRDRKDYLLISQ